SHSRRRGTLGEPGSEEPDEDAIGPGRAHNLRGVEKSNLALEPEVQPIGVDDLPFAVDDTPPEGYHAPAIRRDDLVPGEFCGRVRVRVAAEQQEVRDFLRSVAGPERAFGGIV